MSYQPKMIFNPKEEEVEFMCRGRVIKFAPGEKRILEGFESYHALVEVNTGLVEYDGQDKNPDDLPLNNMPWRALVSLGGSLGVHKVGMKREELIKAIKEYDGEEEGALREPTEEEEAQGA